MPTPLWILLLNTSWAGVGHLKTVSAQADITAELQGGHAPRRRFLSSGQLSQLLGVGNQPYPHVMHGRVGRAGWKSPPFPPPPSPIFSAEK